MFHFSEPPSLAAVLIEPGANDWGLLFDPLCHVVRELEP
jgi:hypothetical protein